MSAGALPPGPLVAYYGDDFTGASAVMEVMAFAGLPSVMFLTPPTPAELARFADCRCIGLAGVSRARSPAWMDEHLPPAFSALAGLGAPLVHYKVCSTFDSAPQIGSIGRAADIGARLMPGSFIPMIVGAPDMGRYQLFGQLFAAIDGVGHRLDRHPVMARHPVTPMDEADLCRHLARQTTRRMGLIDFPDLTGGRGTERLHTLAGADTPVIAIDVLDTASLVAAGRLIWEHRADGRFVLGSQGVEYALVAYWRAAGLLPDMTERPRLPSMGQIAVVSGSCSPVTARQIAHAGRDGFALIRIDATQTLAERTWQAEIARATQEALDVLATGRSPLVFSASGPDDPAVADLARAMASAGVNVADVNADIGRGLGRVLSSLVSRGGIRRAVAAGGDTSGEVSHVLGIHALSAIADIATGAPLCRAHASAAPFDGLELALKGGQIGTPDYFSAVRNGGPLEVRA